MLSPFFHWSNLHFTQRKKIVQNGACKLEFEAHTISRWNTRNNLVYTWEVNRHSYSTKVTLDARLSRFPRFEFRPRLLVQNWPAERSERFYIRFGCHRILLERSRAASGLFGSVRGSRWASRTFGGRNRYEPRYGERIERGFRDISGAFPSPDTDLAHAGDSSRALFVASVVRWASPNFTARAEESLTKKFFKKLQSSLLC